MKRCDVIVPIYNALDALKECLESVVKNTDLSVCGLILINDCSTDKNIDKYLKDFEKKYKDKNVTVLENDINLGFVDTVNRGMKYSKSDVLLLNSDTVVGKDWLKKIQKCAYSMEKVATVTPLSNNATLVSVPNGLQRNELPTNINIDEYNEFVEKCSYHDYPEIPTAHGFCMYIKRDVLDLVGYFDEKTFERGYGEENDFSFRCLDYGYRNIVCDDVIVFHKESQSFSSEREKVIQDHLKKLENRYPEYKLYLDDWCKRFPIEYIGKNIDYSMHLRLKKNVLVLIHDWKTNTGGTTLHVKDLIKGLNEIYNFHVLFPDDGGYKIHSYFGDGENEIYFPIAIERMNMFPRYNQEYKKMLEDIIVSLGIDIIHIHHMIGHYFDVIDVAKKYQVYSVITLHDFYSLCPTINLLYCGEKFCMDLENKDCKKCLLLTKKINHDIISDWQKDWNRFLKKFDKIIVPSMDTKMRILKFYPDISIEDIEHGIELEKNEYSPILEDTFNIAFVGVMSHHKGGSILVNLLKKHVNKKIKFHVFGKSEFKYLTKNRSNYIFHDRYNREDLSKLLSDNHIHLICFFQIWPETYSYTLNEAVASGIPVLSFDIGAGAERVKKYHLGWTIPINTSLSAIEKKIMDIFNDKEGYSDVIKSIQNYKIKTLEEMISEYSNIYHHSSSRKFDQDKLKIIVKQEKMVDLVGSNEQLNAILNSTKWRLINKVKFSPRFVNMVRGVISKRRR